MLCSRILYSISVCIHRFKYHWYRTYISKWTYDSIVLSQREQLMRFLHHWNSVQLTLKYPTCPAKTSCPAGSWFTTRTGQSCDDWVSFLALCWEILRDQSVTFVYCITQQNVDFNCICIWQYNADTQLQKIISSWNSPKETLEHIGDRFVREGVLSFEWSCRESIESIWIMWLNINKTTPHVWWYIQTI